MYHKRIQIIIYLHFGNRIFVSFLSVQKWISYACWSKNGNVHDCRSQMGFPHSVFFFIFANPDIFSSTRRASPSDPRFVSLRPPKCWRSASILMSPKWGPWSQWPNGPKRGPWSHGAPYAGSRFHNAYAGSRFPRLCRIQLLGCLCRIRVPGCLFR